MTHERRDRYREIAEILSRHGLGYLAGSFGLEQRVPFHRGLLGHEPRDEPYTQPEHVRLALEDAGATFVKVGQILATRPDLLSSEYRRELARLHDQVRPISADDVRAVLVEELGAPPEELFATFDMSPLAAASIGQAHAAVLHDGRDAVVKLRRPHVVEQVERDVEILQNLAARAQRHWKPARDFDLVALAEEFGSTLRSELDYLGEARNAERFAVRFAEDAAIRIPEVYWDWTTSRVLTMERANGVNVGDLDGLDRAGIDRRELAELATRVCAEMIFEDGVFHADPHPGNLFVTPGPTITLIDFGMVGTLDERVRSRLGRLLVALSGGRADSIVAAVLAIAPAQGRTDRARLARDVEVLLGRYGGRPVGQMPIGPLVDDVLALVRTHHLRLPGQLALLFKMLVMTEGLAIRLDPDFQPAAVLSEYARGLVAAEVSAAAILRRARRFGADAVFLAEDLPDQIQRLLDALGGPHELRLAPEDLDALGARIDRAGRRTSLALAAGAAINAAAVLLARRRRR